MKNTTRLLAATIASSFALAAVPASAIVYNVNMSGSGVSATGFIQTDNTLGNIGFGNITNYLFNLNDGSSTFAINPGNSGTLGGGVFIATATTLSFDFSGADFMLFQNPSPGSGVNFICFTGNPVCGGSTNRISISASNFGGGIAQRGVQVVATAGAVPEPATWAILVLGFGVMGGMMRTARTTARKVKYA